MLHLRCSYFFTNLLFQLDQLRTGEVAVVLPTDQRMPWVAPVDIARLATSWLLRTDWSGRHVQGVHGPQDLSWDEALAVVTEATRHPVRGTRIADDDMRAALSGAGMSEKQVEAFLGMSAGCATDSCPSNRATPRRPRPPPWPRGPLRRAQHLHHLRIDVEHLATGLDRRQDSGRGEFLQPLRGRRARDAHSVDHVAGACVRLFHEDGQQI